MDALPCLGRPRTVPLVPSDAAPRRRARLASAARDRWLSSINWQVDFYQGSPARRRVDPEFEWDWLAGQERAGGRIRHLLRSLARRARRRQTPEFSREWLNTNAPLLWGARALLDDELSKLLFDSMLVLRSTGYGRFYFPRLDFDDFVAIEDDVPFESTDLPTDYLGLPLRVFTLDVSPGRPPLSVVSTAAQIALLNSYRQYFLRRGSVDLTPGDGDVVLDCGACIGEISALIGALVGPRGAVHLFDPVPLHARYCRLQASLNPTIEHVLHVNVLAVGDVSREAVGPRADATSISPGGLCVDSYATTSLDDYVLEKDLSTVSFIKMDIEGAEMAALQGATRVITRFKPRLAISGYHRPEDLWEIPDKLRTQRGDYRLFFGHHSPIQWESVFYAV